MAKTDPQPKSTFKSPIPERFQDIAAMALLMLVLVVFFGKAAFTGNTLQAGDAISFNSFVPFINAEKAVGEFPLWIPNIFSGMPSYGSLLVTGDRWFDLTVFSYMKIESVVKSLSSNPDVFRIVFEYWVLGLGMYLYMRSRRTGRLVSLFVSHAMVFSSFIIAFVMMGHNTKVWAVMCAPYLLLALDKLTERFRWLYVALLVIAAHMCIESTHVQMVFNIFFGLGIYLLYQLVDALFRKKPVMPLVKTIAAFAIAGGIGAGMAADRYLSVQEYNQYSIRGTGPLVNAAKDHATEGGGLDYDYATNWSFSPEEVLTFVVPGYYGTGVMPYPYKGQIVYAHSYWGQMPFTDLPNYMGFIVLALALYGIVRKWKDVRVQALTVMGGIALFISFGKNLSVLYDLMFNFMPFFNKFRAPSMILALLQFAVPILAGVGLHEIVTSVRGADERQKKKLLYVAIACAAWMFIGFIMQSTSKDSYVQSVEQSQKSELPGEFLFGVAMGDWERCAALGAVFFVGAYFFVRGKSSAGILVAGAILLSMIDLMWIDLRRMELVPKKEASAQFQKTDVIDFLQKDPSLYRIYDVSGGPNIPVYFNLQHVVGYHAAKMRTYQDMLDVAGVGVGVTEEFANYAGRAHGSTGGPIANAFLWNLLNVKYIVSPLQPGPGFVPVFQSKMEKVAVFENPNVLPRAFFVNSYLVQKPLDILNGMKQGSFDARTVAMLEEDPKATVDRSDSTASVHIDSYSAQDIKISANASGNNLLLLSETYYKPAWKAYIDGKEVPVLKTDYVLRSVIVPAGKHVVEFKYVSEAFERGKTISLLTNILVVVATLGLIVMQIQKKKSTPTEA